MTQDCSSDGLQITALTAIGSQSLSSYHQHVKQPLTTPLSIKTASDYLVSQSPNNYFLITYHIDVLKRHLFIQKQNEANVEHLNPTSRDTENQQWLPWRLSVRVCVAVSPWARRTPELCPSHSSLRCALRRVWLVGRPALASSLPQRWGVAVSDHYWPRWVSYGEGVTRVFKHEQLKCLSPSSTVGHIL